MLLPMYKIQSLNKDLWSVYCVTDTLLGTMENRKNNKIQSLSSVPRWGVGGEGQGERVGVVQRRW